MCDMRTDLNDSDALEELAELLFDEMERLTMGDGPHWADLPPDERVLYRETVRSLLNERSLIQRAWYS
jgi:hypothetical protein